MLLKDSNILGGNTDLSLVIMSIVILVTSLYVTNKNFKSRAVSLKSHYIELQKIYFESLDAEKESDQMSLNYIHSKYTNLLDLSENHSVIDDLVFRVDNNDGLSSRKPTPREKRAVVIYKAARCAILVFLYVSPILAIYTVTLL